MFAFTLLLGPIGFLLSIFSSESIYPYLLMNIFLFYVIEILSIILHELAHAFTASSLGMRVFKIVIGRGKTLFKRNLFRFKLELNAIPVIGMVLAAYPERSFSKSKHILFNSAGLFVNIILALIAFLFIREEGIWNLEALTNRVSPIPILFYVNVILIVINVWPRNVVTAFGVTGTDGKQIANGFYVKQEEIDRQNSAWFILENLDQMEKKQYSDAKLCLEKGLEHYPDNFLMLTYLGMVLLRQQDFSQARDCYLRALLKAENPAQEALVKNNIAYIDALLGDTALLPEADTYSEQAMAVLSWLPAIKGTRGTVLLELKKIDEAIVLLTKLYD